MAMYRYTHRIMPIAQVQSAWLQQARYTALGREVSTSSTGSTANCKTVTIQQRMSLLISLQLLYVWIQNKFAIAI